MIIMINFITIGRLNFLFFHLLNRGDIILNFYMIQIRYIDLNKSNYYMSFVSLVSVLSCGDSIKNIENVEYLDT